MARRTRITFALMVSLALATSASAQTTSAARKSTSKAPVQTALPPPDPKDQIKTSDQLKRESVQGAAAAPLRDLNVVKTQIPEILIEALNDPYARPPRNMKCPALVALVRPLDAALGPDVDQTPAEEEDLMDRGKQTALSVAGDLASGAIPFRGVVRRISGANSHDKLVQSAIIAGNIRRAYLKGLGEARGCTTPAAPRRMAAVVQTTAPEPKAAPRPKYPSRTDAPQTPAGNSPSAPRKSRP